MRTSPVPTASCDSHAPLVSLAIALSGLGLLVGCGETAAPKPTDEVVPAVESAGVEPAGPEPGLFTRPLEVHGLTLDRAKLSPAFRAKITRRTAGDESPNFVAVSRCHIGRHVVRNVWESKLPGALELGSLEVGETVRIIFTTSDDLPADISRCEIKVLESTTGEPGIGALSSSFCWERRSGEEPAKTGPCSDVPADTNPWTGSEQLQVDIHQFEDWGPNVRLMGFVNANVDVAAARAGFLVRASCVIDELRWVEHQWVETPTAERFKPGESLPFYVIFFAGSAGPQPATQCRFETIVPGDEANAVYCLPEAQQPPTRDCDAADAGERALASAETVEVGGLSMRLAGSSSSKHGRFWIEASASLLGERVFDSRVVCGETKTESTRAGLRQGRVELGEPGTRLDVGERTWVAVHNDWSELEGGAGCELTVEVVDAKTDGSTAGEDIALFCFNSGGSVLGSCEGAVLPPPEPSLGERNSRSIEGAEEAIQCSESGDSCTIKREFIDQLLSNPSTLARQARVVPSMRDGEVNGYKFYGIRPGSLPKLLGMKNGDLIMSINGMELDSLDAAMAMYEKLRGQKRLSLVYERKGTQETLVIEIL